MPYLGSISNYNICKYINSDKKLFQKSVFKLVYKNQIRKLHFYSETFFIKHMPLIKQWLCMCTCNHKLLTTVLPVISLRNLSNIPCALSAQMNKNSNIEFFRIWGVRFGFSEGWFLQDRTTWIIISSTTRFRFVAPNQQMNYNSSKFMWQ